MLTNEQKIKNYDKMISQRAVYHLRRNVRIDLTVQKAILAGIVITPKEVDDEIKKRAAK